MPKITLDDARRLRRGQNRSWCYNGIDCIATREVHDVLHPRLNARQRRYYAFVRAQQLWAFDMTRRGILVDTEERTERVRQLKLALQKAVRGINKMEVIQQKWDKLAKVTGACPKASRKDGKHKWEKGVEDTPARTCVDCGRSRFAIAPFNPNSSDQCEHLFEGLLGVKPTKNKKGEYSYDEEIIERIGRKHPKLKPLCDAILDVRHTRKRIGFLQARLTPDNRYLSTFSVGTPWTGRISSHKVNGYGGNAQNVAEQDRRIFIPDPGYELCYADLKQAESNLVAHLAGCERYIEAHQLGDVHTYVTRLVWPDLGWTGDLKKDKVVAKQNPEWDPAPGHEYRFQAKRIQHGGNYGMTAFGISAWAHIPLYAARQAARAYHSEFNIQPWQRDIAKTVRNRDALVFPLDFEIKLFGRPWDDHTTKQGLAAIPQGTVGHLIGIAAWLIWRELPEVQLLAQVHDALFFQFPKGRYDLVQKACALMAIPLEVTDIYGQTRTTTIEVEAACGFNWSKRSDDNPRGLEEIEL